MSMMVVRGRERDPGGGGRDLGDLPLVRRRDALGARPARAPHAGRRRCSSRTSTAASSSTASSTRAAAPSIGLRSNLALPLGDAFCSHMAEDRAPRLCDDVGRRRRSTARCAMQQRVERALLPRRAARALRRHARRLAGRGLAAPQRLHRRRRAAVHRCSPACSPPSSSASPTHATCAASTTCCATRPRAWARSAAWPRRSPAATTPAQAICEAACEVMDAPVAFLLEPSGRDFASTAMSGVERAAGDDPAARRRRRRRQGVHRQGDLLRRRRAQPPGARRAAGRGDRRPLGRVRAGAARRRGRRRADRDLAAAARGAAGRAGRRAAAGRRAGRDRDRARGPARARGGAGADRRADRPGHAARVRRGAAARARPRPPRATRRCRSPWSTSTT